MAKELALFCILHPATIEKKNRILSLLATSKPYYQTPSSKCTTWTYLTPSRQLNRFSSLVPDGETNTLLAGMEIYTDKSALTTQLESDMFKHFQARVRAEALFARPEEMTVWYPTVGFVARDEVARPFGNGVLVLMAMLTAHEGKGVELVEVLREYAEWVKQNEPEFLTYSIMTRPKAPDEVLVFERCLGPPAFQKHVDNPVFKKAMKHARRFIKDGKGQEWDEQDNAFVGNVLGGIESAARSKL